MNAYPRIPLSNAEKAKVKERLTKEQDNLCHLCGEPFGVVQMARHDGTAYEYKRLKFLDHNHETGQVRKLLCNDCNSQLPYYETYVDIGTYIEHRKRWLEKDRETIRDKVTQLEKRLRAVERTIPLLEELKVYVETGECTPHIFKDTARLDRTDIETYAFAVSTEEARQLNNLSMESTESWIFVKEYLAEAKAQAVRECIHILQQKSK